MKKKIIIPIIIVAALALLLFLPIPQGTYDDGGTRDYNALTYKIVVWNKIMVELDESGQPMPDSRYRKTSVFWYPNNLKSIDELWKIEISGKESEITYKLPYDQFCYSEKGANPVEINVEDRKYIIDLLNSASWMNDISLYESDFIFYTQLQEIKYYSKYGVFNDVTNKKSATLSEEQRSEVNNILGVSSGAKADEKTNEPEKDHTEGYPYRVWDMSHPDDTERYPHFSVTVPELDNALVEYREDGKVYLDGKHLFGGAGNGCTSFYLADMTGDGKPELCFGMSVGSGIVDFRVAIYDHETSEIIFSLSDRSNHDYSLFVRDGNLCVAERDYMKLEASRTGMLVYDGSKISVIWDGEVNTNIDRDKPPTPGQPIS